MDLEFEWDEEKARSNKLKHGIDFEDAKRVFADPCRVNERDDREYGEERWKTVGFAAPGILAVVYTEPHIYGNPEIVRIISARRASKYEQKNYRAHYKKYP